MPGRVSETGRLNHIVAVRAGRIRALRHQRRRAGAGSRRGAGSGAAGDAKSDLLGFGLCFTAGCSVSVYTVLSRQLLGAGAPVTEVTTIAVALSGLLLIPMLLLSGPGWLVTPPGALTALYLGLFTSAVAFWLNARGLRGLPPAAVATLNLMEPLTAVVPAFLVLGERPSAARWAGTAAIGAGLVVLAVQPGEIPSPPAEAVGDGMTAVPGRDPEVTHAEADGGSHEV